MKFHVHIRPVFSCSVTFDGRYRGKLAIHMVTGKLLLLLRVKLYGALKLHGQRSLEVKVAHNCE